MFSTFNRFSKSDSSINELIMIDPLVTTTDRNKGGQHDVN